MRNNIGPDRHRCWLPLLWCVMASGATAGPTAVAAIILLLIIITTIVTIINIIINIININIKIIITIAIIITTAISISISITITIIIIIITTITITITTITITITITILPGTHGIPNHQNTIITVFGYFGIFFYQKNHCFFTSANGPPVSITPFWTAHNHTV